MALDNAGFPSVHSGRYSSLAGKYGVARQLTNRWCSGLAIPSPQILLRLAADLGVSIDWLFGADLPNSAGAEIPVFKLKNPDIEAVSTNFALVGHMRFLPTSPVSGRSYAIVQNWSASLDPPFAIGEELLVDMSAMELEDGAFYVIRTPTSTSIRRFSIGKEDQLVFSRTTPINTFANSYVIDDVHSNDSQRFDVEWRQPGVLILGRVEAVTRSLLPSVPSFFSS